MTDPIQIPYTCDDAGVVTPAPTQLVPAPPKASFAVRTDGNEIMSVASDTESKQQRTMT